VGAHGTVGIEGLVEETLVLITVEQLARHRGPTVRPVRVVLVTRV
jgi:hypothetical protein